MVKYIAIILIIPLKISLFSLLKHLVILCRWRIKTMLKVPFKKLLIVYITPINTYILSSNSSFLYINFS